MDFEILKYITNLFNSITVSPPQVRCQHRRQYRPRQVSQLRRGNRGYPVYNYFK